MSSPLFKADILFTQRLLKSAGLYTGNLDGQFGKITKGAEDEFERLFVEYGKKYGTFDLRSETNISTLVPKAQVACRQFMKLAKEKFSVGTVQVLSGTRTYAEQDVLFAKRPVVTRARGGQSNHNFGIAFDVGIFVKGQYYTGSTRVQEKAYDDLAKLIKPAMGSTLEWGGDWKSIVDKPHYQLRTGKSVAQCRALLEAGKPYV